MPTKQRGPGPMKNQLSEGQHQAIARRVLRGIRGVRQLVERLEVDPHWMRGVGEASVSKGLCGKEIAEFVLNRRLWWRYDQQ